MPSRSRPWRRLGTIIFAAALLSLPSASPAAATTAPLPNLSSPSVTRVSSGDTYVFARSTDNALIFNRRLNGGGWTGSTWLGGIGGAIVDSPSAVTVGNSAWAFVHGGDDSVYFNRVTNGQSSGYQQLPGLKVTGRVTAASGLDGDSGTTVVFAFARDRDGIGFFNRFFNGAWSGWRKISDRVLASDITPTTGGGNTTLYARGADNAGLFSTTNSVDADFSPWFSLGGGLTSNIAAVSAQDGNTYAFARGYDNALYVNILSYSGFSGWIGLGGGITSDPSAVAAGDGRVTVMVRGNDLGLYANSVDRFGQASGYVGLGGGFLGNPVATPLPAQRGITGLEVFGRGFDNGLYSIKRVNGAWSGFVGLGGNLG